MPNNWDTQATWAYHDATKHTLVSVRSGSHVLDRTNQPRPWKLYKDDLPKVELNKNIAGSGVSALDAVANFEGGVRPSMTLDDFAAVLLLSAGITKTLKVPGGQMQFRAAACTGALHHIELYVVTGNIEGLDAGVYQYGVHDNALRLLRAGDFRQAVAVATGSAADTGSAEGFLVYTTTFWRNAWKYASRAYRHAFWDAGTVIANTLAVAGARELQPSAFAAFVDDDVNRLVGVDPNHEVAVAIVRLGRDGEPQPSSPTVAPLRFSEEALSRRDIEFPAIREMHLSSSLTGPEASVWGRQGSAPIRDARGQAVELPQALVTAKGIEETILKRGSSRRFDGLATSKQAFATVLKAAVGRVPLDAVGDDESRLCDGFVIVNSVEGLEPGAYHYGRESTNFERLWLRDRRQEASHLALDQPLGGDAAFNIYFLADLHLLLDRLGNRGYRAAHLDASIAAGRAYLASYALGLGATGLTFYDDEVVRFFGESATNMSVMFLLAVGNPARRNG